MFSSIRFPFLILTRECGYIRVGSRTFETQFYGSEKGRSLGEGEEEGMSYVDLTADCSFVLVDTSLAIDFVVIIAPTLWLPLSL